VVQQGYEWCVSIDLRSFFDEIPHRLILKLIRREIADEGFATLVARALKAGVIVMNWNHELERRGDRYCRWTDDFLILLKSERAAKRVMDGIGKCLEEGLNLPVNKEKSGVSEVKGLNKYLQGWFAYFGIQEFKKLFGDFDTWIRMNKWQSVHRRTVRFLMNLNWFRKQGLIFLNHFTKRSLEQPLFSR